MGERWLDLMFLDGYATLIWLRRCRVSSYTGSKIGEPRYKFQL